MMCADMEGKLNEYVDGTLAAGERRAVEQHLAACAGCRAAVAELQALLAAAGALPKSIPPRRDLWGGIAERIVGKREVGSGKRWYAERPFWIGALAAAAVLLIVFAISRPTVRSSDRLTGKGWAAVQADYEQSAAALAATLAAERGGGRLRPETVALLERNLQIIDAAIQESRAALARDPGNAELRQLFAAAYRQKVELLRWAARAATSS